MRRAKTKDMIIPTYKRVYFYQTMTLVLLGMSGDPGDWVTGKGGKHGKVVKTKSNDLKPV